MDGATQWRPAQPYQRLARCGPKSGRRSTSHSGIPATAMKITAISGMLSQSQFT